MNNFITKDEIKKYCNGCKNLEVKTAFTSGNKYFYCNNYMLPYFNCITACKKQKEDDEYESNLQMEKSIDRMEQGICECENMFESDSLDNCY